jgi:hypothetical protein
MFAGIVSYLAIQRFSHKRMNNRVIAMISRLCLEMNKLIEPLTDLSVILGHTLPDASADGEANLDCAATYAADGGMNTSGAGTRQPRAQT